MYDVLNQAVIPDFEIYDASLDEAVAQLNQLALQSNSTRKIHFARWSEPDFPTGSYRKISVGGTASAIPGLELLAGINPPALPKPDEERVTLHMTNIPFGEAVRYVAASFHSKAGQRGDVIYFFPDNIELGPLVEHRYRIPPGFIPVSSTRSAKIDARSYLEQQGVEFYEGTSAFYFPKSGRLVVRNTQENIDLCDVLCDGPEPTMIERMKWWWISQRESLRERFGSP
jgi:hypothetical protein